MVGDPGKPDGWIPPPVYENNSVLEDLETFSVGKQTLLFDLYQDPYETNDLSKKYPQIVKKLKSRLR